MYLLEKDLNNVWITFLKRLQKLKQETVENKTGMAEKSRWDQANRRQKPGLVWRNIREISQIITDYFYLTFFLLIILWAETRADQDSHMVLQKKKCFLRATGSASFWLELYSYVKLCKAMQNIEISRGGGIFLSCYGISIRC